MTPRSRHLYPTTANLDSEYDEYDDRHGEDLQVNNYDLEEDVTPYCRRCGETCFWEEGKLIDMNTEEPHKCKREDD